MPPNDENMSESTATSSLSSVNQSMPKFKQPQKPAKQCKVTLTAPAPTPSKRTQEMRVSISSVGTSGINSGLSRKRPRIEEQPADYPSDEDGIPPRIQLDGLTFSTRSKILLAIDMKKEEEEKEEGEEKKEEEEEEDEEEGEEEVKAKGKGKDKGKVRWTRGAKNAAKQNPKVVYISNNHSEQGEEEEHEQKEVEKDEEKEEEDEEKEDEGEKQEVSESEEDGTPAPLFY
ncbi:hypothetical protein RUND412_005527 [Rhizina undulata]